MKQKSQWIIFTFIMSLTFPLLASNQLSDFEQKQVNQLTKRYQAQTSRPAHCPLSSIGSVQLAEKMQALKNNLLKCSRDNQLLDQLTEQAQAIQDSLDQANKTLGNETSEEDSSRSVLASINGQAVADISNIVNSILSSKECSDSLQNETFLGATADAILNFSQMGLLIPNANGILVSAGGTAIGSIIKLIDTLLTRGYNFEKASDRNSFIKLNCSFYDLRRELEEADAFKVYADEHQRDLNLTRELIEKINKNMQGVDSEYNIKLQEIESKLSKTAIEKSKQVKAARAEIAKLENQVEEEKAQLLSGISNLSQFKDLIDEQIEVFSKPAITVSDDNPAVSQMINMLYQLELVAPMIITGLNEYAPLSSSKGQDRLLIMYLNKFDFEQNEEDYLALQSMRVEEFNDVFRARLLAGFKRISGDIEKKQREVDQQVSGVMQKLKIKREQLASLEIKLKEEAARSVTIGGKKINDLLAQLERNMIQSKNALQGQKEQLKPVETKLINYISAQTTREDDGSASRIDLSEDFNTIANNIYGPNGHDFLMQSQKSANAYLDMFNKMFDTFAKDYLVIKDERYWTIPDGLNHETIRRACQDGKPFIRKFTIARDWKDLGYDFLATNADLFHGYNIDGIIFSSKQEKIQKQHKAVLYTQLAMQNRPVPENMKKYVNKDFGKVLVDVQQASAKAALIQRFITTFDCNQVIEME